VVINTSGGRTGEQPLGRRAKHGATPAWPTDALIGGQGGRCEFVLTDVASARDCQNLVDLAVSRCKRLDVLVNNAVLAGPHSKPLVDTSEGDWDAMMAVNLR
jgi:NAD(P)-dependent dehydrogenase (short-subunit alcohol dehydrogenase family)